MYIYIVILKRSNKINKKQSNYSNLLKKSNLASLILCHSAFYNQVFKMIYYKEFFVFFDHKNPSHNLLSDDTTESLVAYISLYAVAYL